MSFHIQKTGFGRIKAWWWHASGSDSSGVLGFCPCLHFVLSVFPPWYCKPPLMCRVEDEHGAPPQPVCQREDWRDNPSILSRSKSIHYPETSHLSHPTAHIRWILISKNSPSCVTLFSNPNLPEHRPNTFQYISHLSPSRFFPNWCQVQSDLFPVLIPSGSFFCTVCTRGFGDLVAMSTSVENALPLPFP
jgi:hypothetical protein